MLVDDALEEHHIILSRVYWYRDLLAMPEGEFVKNEYVGKYKQWWAMTDQQRQPFREAADKAVQRFMEERKKYDATLNQEPAKPDMHVRRSVVRRRCKR